MNQSLEFVSQASDRWQQPNSFEGIEIRRGDFTLKGAQLGLNAPQLNCSESKRNVTSSVE
jgi:hypothetical protein